MYFFLTLFNFLSSVLHVQNFTHIGQTREPDERVSWDDGRQFTDRERESARAQSKKHTPLNQSIFKLRTESWQWWDSVIQYRPSSAIRIVVLKNEFPFWCRNNRWFFVMITRWNSEQTVQKNRKSILIKYACIHVGYGYDGQLYANWFA